MSRTLPHEDAEGHGQQAPHGHKWYLCCFTHKYLDFRCAEVEALAGMAGCAQETITWRLPKTLCAPEEFVPEMNPFWRVALPGDDVAKHVASRAILTKALMEPWGEGATWEELTQSIQAYPAHLKEPWLAPDKTFKVDLFRHGASIKADEKKDIFGKLAFIGFKGRVDLKNPDVVFRLQLVDVGDGQRGLGNSTQVPPWLYFGRVVAEYQCLDVVAQYRLNLRPYIGPTSMDTELAFIMCSLAQVRPGQFVCDPYIGTGSIGVAAAHYGAFVMGLDIDPRVVKIGKQDTQGRPLDVFSNFRHYSTAGRLVALVCADMTHQPWRTDSGLHEVFHSIIGDPPYGVRAGGRKLVPRDIEVRDRATHISGTSAYGVGECLRDLLEFAAQRLVLGGRLVFFVPAHVDLYTHEELPSHPMLKLLHNCEQLLNIRYSRRLIAMVKVLPYDPEATAAMYAARPDPTSKLDQLPDLYFGRGQHPSGDRISEPLTVHVQGLMQARRYRGKRL